MVNLLFFALAFVYAWDISLELELKLWSVLVLLVDGFVVASVNSSTHKNQPNSRAMMYRNRLTDGRASFQSTNKRPHNDTNDIQLSSCEFRELFKEMFEFIFIICNVFEQRMAIFISISILCSSITTWAAQHISRLCWFLICTLQMLIN